MTEYRYIDDDNVQHFDDTIARQVAEYMNALLDADTPITDVVPHTLIVFGEGVAVGDDTAFLRPLEAELVLAGVLAGRRLR